MIHLVFNTLDVTSLQAAIDLDPTLAGKIVEIKDDYAVGPIENIYEPEGYATRHQWWKNILEFFYFKLTGEKKEFPITSDNCSIIYISKYMYIHLESQILYSFFVLACLP